VHSLARYGAITSVNDVRAVSAGIQESVTVAVTVKVPAVVGVPRR
jgi:hypothetical protein